MAEMVVAVYEYAQTNEGDTSVQVGDILEVVTRECEPGWIHVRNPETGAGGFVPETYVETQASTGILPPPPPIDAGMPGELPPLPPGPSAIGPPMSDYANSSTDMTMGSGDYGEYASEALAGGSGNYGGMVDDGFGGGSGNYGGMVDDGFGGGSGNYGGMVDDGFGGGSGNYGGMVDDGFGGVNDEWDADPSYQSVYIPGDAGPDFDFDDDTLARAPAVDVPADEEKVITEYMTWAEREEYAEVVVAHSEKKKKFGGLKSYTAYKITTPSRGWEVLRRYKHFDWLRERLVKKFPAFSIPTLPSKQISKFDSDLIEFRRCHLQDFLNRCMRHPVIRSYPALTHFLSVSHLDEQKAWKAGKRAAEKDPFTGKAFFDTVRLTGGAGDGNQTVDTFKSQANARTRVLASLETATSAVTQSRLDTAVATNQMAQCLANLGHPDQSCCYQGCERCAGLSGALRTSGETLHDIAVSFRAIAEEEEYWREHIDHERKELKMMSNALKLESKARSSFLSYSSSYSRKDNPTPQDSDKLAGLRRSSEICSATAQAEIAQHHNERLTDTKRVLLQYLTRQAEFFAQVSAQYQGLIAVAEGIDANAFAFNDVFDGYRKPLPDDGGDGALPSGAMDYDF